MVSSLSGAKRRQWDGFCDAKEEDSPKVAAAVLVADVRHFCSSLCLNLDSDKTRAMK